MSEPDRLSDLRDMVLRRQEQLHQLLARLREVADRRAPLDDRFGDFDDGASAVRFPNAPRRPLRTSGAEVPLPTRDECESGGTIPLNKG
jgi:hypothetical protein